MKILMVNKFLYPKGGAEKYMIDLADELKRQGHEVEFFGMEDSQNRLQNSAGIYTSNVDFHSSGIKKLTYALKTIYSREAKEKIKVVLDDFKPDVVHLNNFNFQLTPSIIYGIQEYEKTNNAKVKIIFTAHDYQFVCPNHMMNVPSTKENCEKCLNANYSNCIKQNCIHSSKLKSILGAYEGKLYHNKGTYKAIDKIICCSSFMESKMSKNPSLCGRTVTMHNFVDIKSEKSTDTSGDYVLYFGRYSDEKGVRTLVQSAKELPNIPFVFAGEGNLNDIVSTAANIKNVGFKTGNELVHLISNARFSVYPSEWYENCPLSIMESISLLTPVIASDIGGIPELVKNKENGLLFESKSAEELKKKISNLWSDSALYESLVNGCKKTRFSTAAQYVNEYIKLINEIQAKRHY